MSDEQAKGYGRIGWGVGASVLLHVLVGAAFLVRLPMPVNEPAPEETVQVELVPPPEEQKPEEKAPEEKKPEEKKPEAPKPLNLMMADEPKPEEPKPEPPKPEEPKPEEPKKEEAPPPPPPPPKPEEPKPEEHKPEQPKPEEAKPPEQPTEQPEEAGKGKPQPLDVLRPVVEFGDTDSGPRKAPDGNSSADEGTPDAEPSDAPPVDAPPEPAAPDAPQAPEAAQAPEATKPEQAKGNPVPEIAVPEVSALAASGQGPGAPALPPLPDAPPKAAPKPGTKPALPQAKRLFSTSDTGEAVARRAMGSIPRGIRASQLCSTELREQLRHGSPSYSPELLPAYRLASGTVMEVRKGAFRAEAQWYDLSFRCEVDEKVTKVTSFAFEVGSPVPQSQWRKRGFPDF